MVVPFWYRLANRVVAHIDALCCWCCVVDVAKVLFALRNVKGSEQEFAEFNQHKNNDLEKLSKILANFALREQRHKSNIRRAAKKIQGFPLLTLRGGFGLWIMCLPEFLLGGGWHIEHTAIKDRFHGCFGLVSQVLAVCRLCDFAKPSSFESGFFVVGRRGIAAGDGRERPLLEEG
jgi:hypothetical protein